MPFPHKDCGKTPLEDTSRTGGPEARFAVAAGRPRPRADGPAGRRAGMHSCTQTCGQAGGPCNRAGGQAGARAGGQAGARAGGRAGQASKRAHGQAGARQGRRASGHDAGFSHDRIPGAPRRGRGAGPGVTGAAGASVRGHNAMVTMDLAPRRRRGKRVTTASKGPLGGECPSCRTQTSIMEIYTNDNDGHDITCSVETHV